MTHITFSYDNTRSGGVGCLCIGAGIGTALSYHAYWLAAALVVAGIALDTRIKKEPKQ